MNHEKLFSKMMQFFPNLSLTVNELRMTPNVSILFLLSPPRSFIRMSEIGQYLTFTKGTSLSRNDG